MARNSMNPKMRIRRLQVERLECRRVLAGIVSGAFEEMLVTRHDSIADRADRDRPAIEGTFAANAREGSPEHSDGQLSNRDTNRLSQRASAERLSEKLKSRNDSIESSPNDSRNESQSRGPWSYVADRRSDERTETTGEGEQVDLPPPPSSPSPNTNAGPNSQTDATSRPAEGENRPSIDARLTPNGSLNLSPPALSSNPNTVGQPTLRSAPATSSSTPADFAVQNTQQGTSANGRGDEVFFDLGALVQSGSQDLGSSLEQSLDDGLTEELNQDHTSESFSLSRFRDHRSVALEALLAESDPLGFEAASRTNDSIDSLFRDLLPAESLRQSRSVEGIESNSSNRFSRRFILDASHGDSQVSFHRSEAVNFADQLRDLDGMMALRMPISLLPTDVVEEHTQESTAWSLPLGASSNSSELLAASGKAVTPRAGLNSDGSDRTEKSNSALRPVLAATTAALGVLYVGRRRQQLADEDERKQSERLN